MDHLLGIMLGRLRGLLLRRRRCIMKKLTKRNRKYNRKGKVVFGYASECGQGYDTDYSTTTTKLIFNTCTARDHMCCEN